MSVKHLGIKNGEECGDPVGYDKALTAIALCPSLEDAKALIEDQGYSNISVKALESIKRAKGDDIEKLRTQLAPKLEKGLNNDLGDEARRATLIIDMALEHTESRLRRNEVAEPWKVAREVSQVRTQGIDKKLAQEGRPTSITETRNLDEVVRSLEALNVVRQVEVTQGSVEGDG